jgi:hypothetical protein
MSGGGQPVLAAVRRPLTTQSFTSACSSCACPSGTTLCTRRVSGFSQAGQGRRGRCGRAAAAAAALPFCVFRG